LIPDWISVNITKTRKRTGLPGMDIRTVSVLFFSPTGTTEKAARAFAEGTGIPHEIIDLTMRETRRSFTRSFTANELVIAGLPVYGGRLPMNVEDFFSGLKGNGTPAVALVMYGNRAYEDALIELKIRLEERGFRVIAGAAFIGEHTFSKKIATGRPNEDDLGTAREFGSKTMATMGQPNSGILMVKGNYPFAAKGFNPTQPGGPLTTHSRIVTMEECTHCGLCVENCPWGAIGSDDAVSTDNSRCMHCLRCIKICPVGARRIIGEKYPELLAEFEKRLNATRKEPELFLPQ
jgi:ferredoxin